MEQSERENSLQHLLRKFVNARDDYESSRLTEAIVLLVTPTIASYIGQKMGVYIELDRRNAATEPDVKVLKCPVCDAEGDKGFRYCLRCGAKRPVGSSFRQTPRPVKAEDAEDIVGDTIFALIQRLHDIREGSVRIDSSFLHYVTGIADNVLHLYWRRHAPKRYRLRNQILYLLRHGDTYGFAIWESDTSAERLCGFTCWRGRQWRATERYLKWCSDPLVVRTLLSHHNDPTQVSLRELIHHVFRWINSPVKLDDLVNGIAQLLGVVDDAPSPDNDEDGRGDGSNDVLKKLERREIYQEIWSGIGLLPLQQRRALLLRLEQDELMMFVEYGIATLEAVAKLLDMPWEQFWEVYKQLPLKDKQIADYIGLPPAAQQKVINLRKSARERIMRRLKSFSY